MWGSFKAFMVGVCVGINIFISVHIRGVELYMCVHIYIYIYIYIYIRLHIFTSVSPSKLRYTIRGWRGVTATDRSSSPYTRKKSARSARAHGPRAQKQRGGPFFDEGLAGRLSSKIFPVLVAALVVVALSCIPAR